jgi:hypothetical protein
MSKPLTTRYGLPATAIFLILLPSFGAITLLFFSQHLTAAIILSLITIIFIVSEIHNARLARSYFKHENAVYNDLEKVLQLTCQTLYHKNNTKTGLIYLTKQAIVEGFFAFQKTDMGHHDYGIVYKPFPPGTNYLPTKHTLGYYCNDNTLLNYLFLTHPDSPNRQLVLTIDPNGFILDRSSIEVNVFTVASILESLSRSPLNATPDKRFGSSSFRSDITE